MYNFSLLNYRTNIPWLKSVKSILDECGLSYVWNNQYFVSATWLYNNVKQILIDQFKQIWHSNLQNSSKALNYRMFKEKLEIGKYFEKLDVRSIRLCKFRTRTETGMWQNIVRENRKCLLCNSGDIGDEFHYIFSCSKFNDSRNLLIKQKIRNRPNSLKFISLMNSNNSSDMNNVCFIRIVNQMLDSPV